MIKIPIFDAIIYYLSSIKDEKEKLLKAAQIHDASDTIHHASDTV